MYKLFNSIDANATKIVIRTTDNACIPFDIQNVDYVAYLKWVSEGNVATPADEVTV
jgi:hypothetical protein